MTRRVDLINILRSSTFAYPAPIACRSSRIGKPLPPARAPRSTPALRAVYVTVNEAAREQDINLHKNWRVPDESVIARVFETGGYAAGREDLSWWTTSGGSHLPPCPVIVKAKKNWNTVAALLIPQL